MEQTFKDQSSQNFWRAITEFGKKDKAARSVRLKRLIKKEEEKIKKRYGI